MKKVCIIFGEIRYFYFQYICESLKSHLPTGKSLPIFYLPDRKNHLPRTSGNRICQPLFTETFTSKNVHPRPFDDHDFSLLFSTKLFVPNEFTLSRCLGRGSLASPQLAKFRTPSKTDGPSNFTQHLNGSPSS